MVGLLLPNCLDFTPWNDAGGSGGAAATNPFLASASPPAPQQTSQNQQILDLFASNPPAPAPAAAPAARSGGSALDDLLSLGLGNGTSAPAPAPAASNPFADMFASSTMSQPPKPPMPAYGGNGFGPGVGAPQGGFYQPQQAPVIQQPFGGNNINAVFGSNNDQGEYFNFSNGFAVCMR